jgi:hypothetical protein
MALVLVRSTVSPKRKIECKQEKNGAKRGVLDSGFSALAVIDVGEDGLGFVGVVSTGPGAVLGGGQIIAVRVLQ